MKTRVVLFDDSASALAALRQMLERSGAFDIVGEARTGQGALELVEATRPDLVTMDVYLDGQDGVQAARAILERVPSRVVLVTALDPGRADLARRALVA
ncbi:MAG TPA: response regulator, partial [Polyangiaceae bacterium]